MAAVTGLTLTKSFTYRDVSGEHFSNTYHFKGLPPGDDASWLVFTNDVVNKEKTIFYNSTHYVSALGYDSDDPTAHHVFAHNFETPGPPPTGTLVPGGNTHMAGDQAALVEWKLNRLSVKGKPVYLRKYFHGGFVNPSDADRLDDIYWNALNAFASPGGIQAIHGGLRSQRVDDTVVAAIASNWVTTRTLKRRGKRPR